MPQRLTVRSWLTLLTSFAILTVAFAFGLFCWPAIYRPLTRAYGWTFAQANAGGSIVLFLIGILSPFVGTLVDRFKPKRVILGGTLIVAAALALLSTIHSRPDRPPLWGPQQQYYAFCVLLGVGASAVSILPTSILIGPFSPVGAASRLASSMPASDSAASSLRASPLRRSRNTASPELFSSSLPVWRSRS